MLLIIIPEHLNSILLIAGLIVAGTLCFIHWRISLSRSRLPKSPPGHWLRGNKDLMAKPHRPVVLGIGHGDILSLVTPFETTVMLNTIELATQMLDKQSNVSSDRPSTVMANTLMGWGTTVAFRTHDQTHKLLRRLLASALNPVEVRNYIPQQSKTVAGLVKQIHSDPSQFLKFINGSISSFIMRAAYGFTPEQTVPFVEISLDAMRYLAIGTMSHFWVNWFPILRCLPEWFPGTGFHTIGREGKDSREAYVNKPFQPVFNQVSSGYIARPSFTSRALEERGAVHASPEDVNLVKTAGAAFFLAGFTTTTSFVATFVLMAALYPELAQRAQAEIDSVVSGNRLPTLDDRQSLPFFDAFIQETMRMYPSAPLGVPHRASQGFEFQGYWIPKGTTIISNIWAMMHDPRVYASPHTFDPTRFLKANPGPDPRKIIFGFGRRACPGNYLAINLTWLMCAGLLTVFDITPSPELLARVDEVGGRNSPNIYQLFEPFGVSIGPLPFLCVIKTRNQTLVENL